MLLLCRPSGLSPRATFWGTLYHRITWKVHTLATCCALSIILAPVASGQSTTTVQDTIYTVNHQLANGTIVVSNPATFTSFDGSVVPGKTSITVNISNGALSVPLVPNIGSTPTGTFYTADYHIQSATFREFWIVPQSATPVNLAAVRTLGPPTPALQFPISQVTPPTPCPAFQFLEWTGGGWACSASSGASLQTNGTPNTLQTILNLQNGPSTDGVSVNFSNPSSGNVQASIVGLPALTTAGDVFYWNGSALARFAGNSSGTNCFQENPSGVPSWGACGSGGGGAWSGVTAGANSNPGTFSASGNTWDWTATTLFKLRVAAGLSTTVNGDIGQNSTDGVWHAWTNGNDRLMLTSTNKGAVGQIAITNGDGTYTMADPVVSWNNGAATTASWTSATANNTTAVVALTSPNMAMVVVTLGATSTMTGGQLNFELDDGSGNFNWPAICDQVATSTSQTTFSLAVGNVAWQCNVAGFSNFRVRLNPQITGTGTATLRITATTAPIEAQLTIGQAVAANLNATVVFPSAQPVTLASTTITGTVSENLSQVNGVALGSPSNYGTSPGAVSVPGVNAFVTNTVGISGTITANQGTANATPWNENVAQYGGTATSLGQKVMASSIPIVPASDYTPSDTVGTTGALNASNAAASVVLAGQQGASVLIASGTLAATVVPEYSTDGGTTWNRALLWNSDQSAAQCGITQNGVSNQIVVTNPNPSCQFGIIVPSGSSNVRVRNSAFTSGTANATIRAALGINQRQLDTQYDATGAAIGAFANFGTSPGAVSAIGANVSLFAGVTGLTATGSSLNVNITGGAGAGGTSSNFGAAFPTAGTAIGVKNGANMVNLTADASNNLDVNCVVGCAAAGDQTTGSTALGAINNTISVVLAGERGAAFQLQSGGTGVYTVTPQCSFDGGTIYNANGYIQDPFTGNVTTTAVIASAQATTDYPVMCPQGSSNAQMKVTAYTSGTANWVARATVNTWPAVSWGLVSTSAPSYTAGQVNAFSLTLSGALRTDSSATTQPISGTVTANQGGAPWSQNLTQVNSVALGSPSNYGTSPGVVSVMGVNAFITNTPAVSQSGNWTARIVGNVGGILDAAQNAAAPANELVAGAVFNNASGTTAALTAGNATQLQSDSHGLLLVNLAASQATVTVAGTGQFNVTCTAANCPVNLSQVAGTALGATAVTNFGTAPAAAAVPGVNASLFSGTTGITNTSGALDVNLKTSSITLAVSGTVTSNQGGAPWSVVGTLTNNNAAPGANNIGVLPALANSSAPSYTNGDQVLLSTDLSGNVRMNCVTGCGGGSLNATYNTVPNWANPLAPLSLSNGANANLQLDAFGRLITIDANSSQILAAVSVKTPANSLRLLGTFNRPVSSTADALDVNLKSGPFTYKASNTQSVTSDTSEVVQLNPNQPPLATPLNVQAAGNAAVVNGQQAVTATATALATNTTKNVCIKALSENTINVYVGGSGVTVANGMELAPGNSVCQPATNTNIFFVIANATGASVSWMGTN